MYEMCVKPIDFLADRSIDGEVVIPLELWGWWWMLFCSLLVAYTNYTMVQRVKCDKKIHNISPARDSEMIMPLATLSLCRLFESYLEDPYAFLPSLSSEVLVLHNF